MAGALYLHASMYRRLAQDGAWLHTALQRVLGRVQLRNITVHLDDLTLEILHAQVEHVLDSAASGGTAKVLVAWSPRIDPVVASSTQAYRKYHSVQCFLRFYVRIFYELESQNPGVAFLMRGLQFLKRSCQQLEAACQCTSESDCPPGCLLTWEGLGEEQLCGLYYLVNLVTGYVVSSIMQYREGSDYFRWEFSAAAPRILVFLVIGVDPGIVALRTLRDLREQQLAS